MIDPTRGETPESAVLPPKSFLEEDQLLEIWETRGLKFRVDEFYEFCMRRGLMAHFRKDSFRKKIFGMLRSFLCKGDTRRDPRFVPPSKPYKRV
jgi:hypothetical protein